MKTCPSQLCEARLLAHRSTAFSTDVFFCWVALVVVGADVVFDAVVVVVVGIVGVAYYGGT